MYGAREIIRTDLLPNEIRDITNASNDSLLWVLRDSGFTKLFGRFTRVTTPWTLDKDEYKRRNQTPWPRAPEPPAEPAQAATPHVAPDGGEDGRGAEGAAIISALVSTARQSQSADGLPEVKPKAKPKRSRKGKGRQQAEEQQ